MQVKEWERIRFLQPSLAIRTLMHKIREQRDHNYVSHLMGSGVQINTDG